jgi:hypothetical protein
MVHLIAPEDFDPDDALEARCLRDHDGAPALELPHPEEEARDWVLMYGNEIPAVHAGRYVNDYLFFMENGGSDDFPY